MRLRWLIVGVMLLAPLGCGGKASQCKALAKVLTDSGAKMAEAAKGKGDSDPALPKLLEDYASDLKKVELSDATVAKKRDDFAAALTKQAAATKAWQQAAAANDAAGKTKATAQVAEARSAQDKAGKELVDSCAK